MKPSNTQPLKLSSLLFAAALSAFAAESVFAADVTVQVTAGQESFGKVSGGKANAKAGSTLTLKATASKGYGFAGWYDGEELASWQSSWKYQVTDESKAFSARFVAAKDDGFALTDKVPEGYEFGIEYQPKRSDCLAIGYKIGVPHSEVTVKVSGLPSGIKAVYGTDPKFNGSFEFEGTAKKEGVYFVTFEAKNANGYVQSLTQMWVVGYPTPYLDDIPIGSLGTMRVGEGYSRTWYDKILVVQKFAVSGLPPGLKFDAWAQNPYDDDEFYSRIYGYPTKPGAYTIDFAKTYSDKKVYKSRIPVIVKDPGSFYISVEVGDSSVGRGTAKGSGVYRVGAKVPLSAKPASKDYVFAGWFTDKACSTKPLVGGENHTSYDDDFTVSGEYRKASDTMIFYYDCIDKARSIYAKFLPKDSDYLSLSTDLGSGSRWSVGDMSMDMGTCLGIEVDSGTLPTVTAKNLPPGFSLVGNRRIYADYSKVKPGMVYENVQLIAKNQTGKTDSKAFAICTGNYKSYLAPGLKTEDDAYEAMVGEDIFYALWYADLKLNDDYGDWKMSVSGLPPGVKANYYGEIKAFWLLGSPTKTGVYTPVFTFTRGSGASKQTEKFSFTLTVYPQSPALIGTFNGVTTWDSSLKNIRPESRLLTLTSAEGGKLTAKVGKLSFSGNGWVNNDDGYWAAYLKTGKVKEGGKTLIYELYAYGTSEYKELGANDLTGFMNCWSVDDDAYINLDGTDMYFFAKQNCYGKGYWTDEKAATLALMMKTTGYIITGYYFEESEAGRKYSLSPTSDKNAAIKLAVDKKGVMKLSGTIDLTTYGGKKFKVSGSTTLLPGVDHSLTGWLPVDAGANGKCLFYFVYGGDNPDSAMFYKDAGN